MKVIFVFILALHFLSVCPLFAEDVYKDHRKRWLEIAESLLPELYEEIKSPIGTVEMVEDESAYQKIKTIGFSSIEDFYKVPIRKNKEGISVDFGDHYTGDLEFTIASTIAAHAPLRLKIKFAEVPAEMAASFNAYKGSLSQAWLQEEILTIHTFPATIKLTNRYAFRYVQFEVLACAYDMDFTISEIKAFARSSAGSDLHADAVSLNEDFQAINDISLKTLKECMQTVFEDGPKRDRRIWVGDLKLQALANYYSFQNNDLVKRGLYLHAATAQERGLVFGTLFERPTPHPQFQLPIDYSLLYNTVLYEYYEATGDKETLEDLWVVAKYQISNVQPYISSKGEFSVANDWWFFLDWNSNLDKKTALHGTVIYAFEISLKIAKMLEKEHELKELPGLIRTMKKFARDHYYDKQHKVFVSGDDRQVSIASQVWMILSGTVSAKEGRALLEKTLNQKETIKPVSPYLYHYVVEALIQTGMYAEARSLMQSYWGDMVKKGADTFWEVYDPEDDFLSPYGSYMMNSYCHAWSCTPVYFVRKYYKELFGSHE
jgi:alpha-L-rhamnosidase